MIAIEIFLLVLCVVSGLAFAFAGYKVWPYIVAKKRQIKQNREDELKRQREARLDNIIKVGRTSSVSQRCVKCQTGFNGWYDFHKGSRVCPNCESVNHILSDDVLVATKSNDRPTLSEAMEWKRNK